MMKDPFLFQPDSWPGVNLINTISSAVIGRPLFSYNVDVVIENPELLQNLY
jgi:hypothetical protein